MSNLYQRMTETLAINMGDTLVVYRQFEEAVTYIAELELELAESKQLQDVSCSADCMNKCMNYAGAIADCRLLEAELAAAWANSRHWMAKKEELEVENKQLRIALEAIRNDDFKGKAAYIAQKALEDK